MIAQIPSFNDKEEDHRSLAEVYSQFTLFMHDSVTEMYESLFTEDGRLPLIDDKEVMLAVKKFKTVMNREADALRDALAEHLEQNPLP